MNEYSNQEVYKLSKEAAHKAIELNPKNAEAYLALGNIAMKYDWDWEKAEEYLLKSIEISRMTLRYIISLVIITR